MAQPPGHTSTYIMTQFGFEIPQSGLRNGDIVVRPETSAGRLVTSYVAGEFGSMLTFYGPAPRGGHVGPYVQVLMDPTARRPDYQHGQQSLASWPLVLTAVGATKRGL